jgi:hypothetical protein
MESSGPTPSEVPLADAAIATEIANAAARGRGADRAPTLEQLLAAFGESAATPAARARVGAALRVAGMGVRPDRSVAEPGQRLVLLPPGVSEGRSRGRALLGIVGVVLVLGAAAVAATQLEGGKDDDVASNLPAGPTTSAPATTSTVTTTATDTTATDTTATGTTATGTVGNDTTPTQTTTTPSSDDAAKQAAAAERRRKAAARKKREQRAAAKNQAAASAGLVTVRVDSAGKPTFLCVDDGSGKTLFSGTLDGKKTFRAKRVRMNIGLKSTFITVNGNPVALDGSPTGLDITRAGGAKALALGQRPCA